MNKIACSGANLVRIAAPLSSLKYLILCSKTLFFKTHSAKRIKLSDKMVWSSRLPSAFSIASSPYSLQLLYKYIYEIYGWGCESSFSFFLVYLVFLLSSSLSLYLGGYSMMIVVSLSLFFLYFICLWFL